MHKQTLKFVIVGHVDHGKSTLIGRLLYDTESLPPDKMEEVRRTSKELGRETEFAYLLDHLEEERQQGITIDTTQVFFKTDKREYIIIDAPGHVEFVKNMITGASQAEAALLIVDAKLGVEEQTKRHATILSMLGIGQVVVLINKMDMVNFDRGVFEKLKKDVERFLGTFHIVAQHSVPISALKGDNVARVSAAMPWYSGPTVLGCLDLFRNKASLEAQPLIFPVQGIFKLDDKRIVVGRIETGKIRQGEDIWVLPEHKTTKVKTIEKFLEERQECFAGECIGITTDDSLFIERGNLICDKENAAHTSDTFRANIFWMSKKDYARGEKVTLRVATQEMPCKIEHIHQRINSSSLEVIGENADELKNLEIGSVTIKTKKPVAIESFNKIQEIGRFVLVRDESTCAGGIITSTT